MDTNLDKLFKIDGELSDIIRHVVRLSDTLYTNDIRLGELDCIEQSIRYIKELLK